MGPGLETVIGPAGLGALRSFIPRDQYFIKPPFAGVEQLDSSVVISAWYHHAQANRQHLLRQVSLSSPIAFHTNTVAQASGVNLAAAWQQDNRETALIQPRFLSRRRRCEASRRHQAGVNSLSLSLPFAADRLNNARPSMSTRGRWRPAAAMTSCQPQTISRRRKGSTTNSACRDASSVAAYTS